MNSRFYASLILVCIAALCTHAQSKTVSGIVTDVNDGSPLPGVNVVVKGTELGAVTDINGEYVLQIPTSVEAPTLVFSFIGMKTMEESLAGRTSVSAALVADVAQLSEVVVTAQGISREKQSLGYATQQIGGDALTEVKTYNYTNSLSGKVSGVQIKRNNNFGGSTNVLVRGNNSLSNNNQALFVVDGVPISNAIPNSGDQQVSGTGYDYGNLAADINPDDIESISVLKGAAASVLYGARAANGVIVITTKKGLAKKNEKGIGVTISSAVTTGVIDRTTFPVYQQRYGAGYSRSYGPNSDGYFTRGDVDGDGVQDDLAPFSEDASFGGPFDPNLSVFQWNSLYPDLPTYRQKTPWVAAKNGPITFFETPVRLTNSISLDKAFDRGSFRLSYTNHDERGIMPNSHFGRNSVSLNAVYKLTDRLTVTGFANYVNTNARGRNTTGYSGNLVGSFRQWWQMNVDVKELKRAYDLTHRNISWNPKSYNNLTPPAYWDNPYWDRFQNYQSDSRDRFLGIASADYKVTEWFHAFARASIDTYSGIQEERLAVGSNPSTLSSLSGVAPAGYKKRLDNYSERNFALILNFDGDIVANVLNIKGVLGVNYRQTDVKTTEAATNGGLVVPGLYALQNTVSPLLYPSEIDSKIGVLGVFANASFGYKNFLFLEGAVRRDQSSTLPKGKNSYFYPSVSASFVFSHFIHSNAITFGKFRVNYAVVGNSAPFARNVDLYNLNTAFNGPLASAQSTKRNPNLAPEQISSVEVGLEMDFLERRLGFDLSLYRTSTTNQIVALATSSATGYLYRDINSGEIENKGIELSGYGVPVRAASGFEWRIGLNWTKYASQVVSLYRDAAGNEVTNYTLGTFNGGVSINARKGESYGVIQGQDYIYTQDGRRVIDATTGLYAFTSASDRVIGSVIPDWIGGITNTFSYKNISLSFLIDSQVGGSIFSLDQSYGLATGLYKETDYTNDLGNPVRNSLSDGGGYINRGASVIVSDPDTKKILLSAEEITGRAPVANSKVIGDNAVRVDATTYATQGYKGYPNKAFVYDASYVKLREASVSYSLPSATLANTFLRRVTFSFVGSNLWIIYKNLPHADPESGLGAGNLQGYTTGSLPTVREFTFNVKLQF